MTKKNLNDKNSSVVRLIIVLSIIIIVILAIVYFFNKDDKKFALNPIYNVYPDEVKKIYSNMVLVSCYGDWYLDIEVDDGKKVDIKEIDNNLLIDYVFSYMDKNNLLDDEITVDKFDDVTKLLFYKELDLINLLDNYMYGDYIYTKNGEAVIRTEKECVSSNNYVTQLSGYAFSDKMLSIDVNIGYLKNGILYDINDKNLGKYDGDPKNIGDKFAVSPYYRFNYVNIDDNYKLDTVEFNIRY